MILEAQSPHHKGTWVGRFHGHSERRPEAAIQPITGSPMWLDGAFDAISSSSVPRAPDGRSKNGVSHPFVNSGTFKKALLNQDGNLRSKLSKVA